MGESLEITSYQDWLRDHKAKERKRLHCITTTVSSSLREVHGMRFRIGDAKSAWLGSGSRPVPIRNMEKCE